MVTPAVDGIDLFRIAGRSISGWIPSFKTGTVSHVRQPFCSQLEERLLLWLEYHPQVAWCERGEGSLERRCIVAAPPLGIKRKTVVGKAPVAFFIERILLHDPSYR